MKVVVANQPRILRESIAMAIATIDEVEVLIEVPHEEAILLSVKQHKPDCLILSLEVREANPRICRAILSRFPQTLILAIGPKTLTVYWFELIVRCARKECSLQSILDLLRTKLTEQTAGDRPTPAEGSPAGRDIPAITPPRTRACMFLTRIDELPHAGPRPSPAWPDKSRRAVCGKAHQPSAAIAGSPFTRDPARPQC